MEDGDTNFSMELWMNNMTALGATANIWVKQWSRDPKYASYVDLLRSRVS